MGMCDSTRRGHATEPGDNRNQVNRIQIGRMREMNNVWWCQTGLFASSLFAMMSSARVERSLNMINLVQKKGMFCDIPCVATAPTREYQQKEKKAEERSEQGRGEQKETRGILEGELNRPLDSVE